MIALVLAACGHPSPVAATGPSLNHGLVGEDEVGGERAAMPPPLLHPAWVVNGPNQSLFGYALGAGDTNGDGFGDLLVGSPLAQNYRGRAEVFFGDPAGPQVPAGWSAAGAGDYTLLGESVVSCDLDGDGYAEVAVGSSELAQVRVYTGGPAGPGGERVINDPDDGVLIPGDSGDSGANWSSAYTAFGWSLACGDTDADGFRDLIVGAPFAGFDDHGRVRIYRGGSSGVSTVASWTVEGQQDSAWGDTVAFLGDVDGDGYGDLAVGTEMFSTSGAAVFHGGPAGPDPVMDWFLDLSPPALALIGTSTTVGTTPTTAGGTTTTTGGTTGRDTADGTWDTGGEGPFLIQYGERVAEAGDVNADGYMDLLIGSPEYEDHDGIALLYLGGPSGLSPTSSWTVEASSEAWLGHALGGLSDLDGDGYRELAVLAPLTAGAGNAMGATYVFRGTATGAETTAAFTLLSTSYYGYAWDVVDAGDVDGDGYTEVAFSVPYDNEVRLFTAAAPGAGSTDTATDTGTPATTGPDPNTTTDGTNTDGDDDPPGSEGGSKGGCGCATGGSAGVAVLAPLLLLVRRRRQR